MMYSLWLTGSWETETSPIMGLLFCCDMGFVKLFHVNQQVLKQSLICNDMLNKLAEYIILHSLSRTFYKHDLCGTVHNCGRKFGTQ